VDLPDRDLSRVRDRRSHQVPADDRAVFASQGEMGMDDRLPVARSDIALHRQKLTRFRDAVNLVALSVPVAEFRVAHHTDAADDDCRACLDLKQVIHQALSIQEAHNQVVLRSCYDHVPSVRHSTFRDLPRQLETEAPVHYSPAGMTSESKAKRDVAWVVDHLVSRFGAIHEPDRDPVEELILTILSQNTTDTNRDRAFASLLETFGTLDAVAEATETDIAQAIKIGGLQAQKSRSIRAVLDRIRSERGELSIDHLGQLPVEEAMAWLTSLPGVGWKTAGIVCLFSFGLPFFPIDTHIRRILTRLGWFDGRGDPHEKLNAILPKESGLLADLHLQMIRLGRVLCSPKAPKCGECPICSRCSHGKNEGACP